MKKVFISALTIDNVLNAYKVLRKHIDNYKKNINLLKKNELLRCVVYKTTLAVKKDEEKIIKNILCGQHMLELLHKLQMDINYSLITFCINFIIEEANLIELKYNECINHELLNTFDRNEIKKEFCKMYELEDCRMSDFVLHVIKETSNNIRSFVDTYISKSGYQNELVISENIDDQSIDCYQIHVPSDKLDAELCQNFAQQLNLNNHKHKKLKFKKTNSDISVLYSIELFSVKVIFFHIRCIDGNNSLNISVYHNRSNIKASIQFPC